MPVKCKCQLKHASMEDLAKLGIGYLGCTDGGRYVCPKLDTRRRTHPKRQEWYSRGRLAREDGKAVDS